MAKILLVISIVITLLTAGLGFMTKAKVDNLQSTLSSTKNELSSTKGTLESTKKDLTKTKDDLTAANKAVDEAKQKLTAAETDLQKANEQAKQLASDIEARNKQIEELNVKIADAGGKPSGEPGAQKSEIVVQLEEQLKRASAERDELKAVQETLNNRVTEAEGRLHSAETTVKRYQAGVARQDLSGRVLAVNQGWNFVVLDVGDRQGAAVNAPLLVLRGGQPVARLRITSVLPTTSIADVIPGSTARGTTVQPNDRVVFAGSRSQSPQPVGGPAAPAPSAPQAPAPELPQPGQ